MVQCTLMPSTQGRGRHNKPKLKIQLQTQDTIGVLSLSAKTMVRARLHVGAALSCAARVEACA